MGQFYRPDRPDSAFLPNDQCSWRESNCFNHFPHPSHTSSFETSDPSTDFAIRLPKPDRPRVAPLSFHASKPMSTSILTNHRPRCHNVAGVQNFVCEQCEKRMGSKVRSPGCIDFHGPINVLTPKGGMVSPSLTTCNTTEKSTSNMCMLPWHINNVLIAR
jgi:hypothetical protein